VVLPGRAPATVIRYAAKVGSIDIDLWKD